MNILTLQLQSINGPLVLLHSFPEDPTAGYLQTLFLLFGIYILLTTESHSKVRATPDTSNLHG